VTFQSESDCPIRFLFFLCRFLKSLPETQQFIKEKLSEKKYAWLPGWNTGNNKPQSFPNPKFEQQKLLNEDSGRLVEDVESLEDEIILHQESKQKSEKEKFVLSSLNAASYEIQTLLHADSHLQKLLNNDFMKFIINHGSYDDCSKLIII
jgi:hypothetical protein